MPLEARPLEALTLIVTAFHLMWNVPVAPLRLATNFARSRAMAPAAGQRSMILVPLLARAPHTRHPTASPTAICDGINAAPSHLRPLPPRPRARRPLLRHPALAVYPVLAILYPIPPASTLAVHGRVRGCRVSASPARLPRRLQKVQVRVVWAANRPAQAPIASQRSGRIVNKSPAILYREEVALGPIRACRLQQHLPREDDAVGAMVSVQTIHYRIGVLPLGKHFLRRRIAGWQGLLVQAVRAPLRQPQQPQQPRQLLQPRQRPRLLAHAA